MTQTKEKMNPLSQVTPPFAPGATTNLGASGLAGNSHGVSGSRPSMAAIGAAKVGNYFGSTAGSSLLGALGSGVMNFVSGAVNRHWQKKDYERMRQDALADYQMQRQDYLSDLADERAYNSPAAQRARLLQAGINPNTVFGNGSVSNTSSPASNVSQMRGSEMSSPGRLGSLGSDIVDAIMPTMNVSLSDLQAENMREDVAIKKANVLKMLSETRGIDANTKARLIENGYLDLMFSSSIDEKRSNIKRVNSQLLTDTLDRAQRAFDLNKLSPAKVSKIQSEISLAYKELESLAFDLSFKNESKRLNLGILQKQNRKLGSEIGLIDSEKLLTDSRKVISDLDARLKSLGLPADKVAEVMHEITIGLDMLISAISPFDNRKF